MPRKIKSAAVIGSGVMGGGIAALLAGTGGHAQFDFPQVVSCGEVDQALQEVAGELLHGGVAHRQYQAIALQEQHFLTSKSDPVTGTCLLDGLVRGITRQQHVLVQFIAESCQARLVDVVVRGEAIVSHGGDDTGRDRVVVTVQALALSGRKNREVRRGELVTLLVDIKRGQLFHGSFVSGAVPTLSRLARFCATAVISRMKLCVHSVAAA